MRKNSGFPILLVFLSILFPFHFLQTQAISVQQGREQLLLDRNWRFHLGNASMPEADFGYGIGSLFAKAGEAVGAVKPDFNDSSWRTLDLPHDWAVELDFVNVPNNSVKEHGYKPIGRQFPATSIGWYRRSISIPASDEGRRLVLRFDGVSRDCVIWLNGHYIGRNLSGYSEFDFDITDYVWYGKQNVLVVRVDATQNEGWFYEGAGIYRHVWLMKLNPLHIPEYGIFAHTEMTGNATKLHIETTLSLQDDRKDRCVVHQSVFDEDGRRMAETTSKTVELNPWSKNNLKQEITMHSPRLWTLEDPYLYSLVSVVQSEGRTIDSVVTSFGVRSIRFDKDKGFFLNEKPIKIKGVCCHQDHAGVGSALPDRLQYYRIELLKEMGCNAYRTSHNPPTRELLDACDRLGMLVMDENRLMGSSPDMITQFDRLILRDRNHASVILWSIGNEEWVIQNNNVGKRLALSMLRRKRELDPTRLATYAANNGNQYDGINSVMPIRGFNYMKISDIDKYRKDHPDQILIGTEEASTLCTRGIYANDSLRGYLADYDQNAPGWGELAERWWKFYAQREWLAGAFVWTGFDYRGEPTPFAWPCINSHFGIMDVCGFPKNNYYYYQSWWSDKDVLHLAPHWNWPGKEGQAINVWCQSNCETVELFLNGRTLGRKPMEANSHLEWNVPYEPGVLEARGTRRGKEITAKVETTGAPASVLVLPDRTAIQADGEDVSVVNISVVDAKGRTVPTAADLIRFELTGPGVIIGVGNGDPSSHDPDKYPDGKYQRHLFNGWCQVILQSILEPGVIKLRATAEGLTAGETAINALPARPRAAVE